MGPEIIGILWAIPGSIVLAFLLLCVAADAARPYTIPTLIFALLCSGIVTAMQSTPTADAWAFYVDNFLGGFFFFGTGLGLFALTIRSFREGRS